MQASAQQQQLLPLPELPPLPELLHPVARVNIAICHNALRSAQMAEFFLKIIAVKSDMEDVSDHWPINCLFSSLFRRCRSSSLHRITDTLRGNFTQVTPRKGPVMLKGLPFLEGIISLSGLCELLTRDNTCPGWHILWYSGYQPCPLQQLHYCGVHLGWFSHRRWFWTSIWR